MRTTVDEIAPEIYRISTYIPEVGPTGLAFNQFLIRDAEPMLFHTGMRGLFPLVSEAISSLIPLGELRWVSFSHVEADECGAMNAFLGAAPGAAVVHGALACMVSLNDLADRPPVVIGDEPLDIGAKRMRFLPTPHVPHNWESGLWYEETTGTLFSGDLFTAGGDGVALTDGDLVEGAMSAETVFHSTSMGPDLLPTIDRLASLEPTTLATMHGPSHAGRGGDQLRSLRDSYAALLVGV